MSEKRKPIVSNAIDTQAQQELVFLVRYWCKNCGEHFDGDLVAQKIGTTIRVIRAVCPHCQSQNVSPHVEPGSVVTSLFQDPTEKHYVEAIKHAMRQRSLEEGKA